MTEVGVHVEPLKNSASHATSIRGDALEVLLSDGIHVDSEAVSHLTTGGLTPLQFAALNFALRIFIKISS